MNIIYRNNKLRFSDFWVWISRVNASTITNDQLNGYLTLLEEPGREEVIIGSFRAILGILTSVRRGKVNPIGLRLHLKKRVYLVTPNGDLFLEREAQVKLKTIKLDEMLEKMGQW